MTDWTSFRAEFPVLERIAYLNAGTDGPIPARAAAAAEEELRRELRDGRAGDAHFGRLAEMASELRARLAAIVGAEPSEIALTRSTTDGVNTVVAGLELGPGDEVVTSDEEHPGVLAPLAVGARRRGFELRVVPVAGLAAAVGPRTALVACSHVSWISGAVVDTEALSRSSARVLLDGAQGAGAVPVDVRAIGCDFYAASGQKWLCGQDGSGFLYVAPERLEELAPPWPGYASLADPGRPADLRWHAGAQRFDTRPPDGPGLAWSLAALDVLQKPGIDSVTDRATSLAAWFAELLQARGVEVAPRGRSTLVAWRSADPAGDVASLEEQGFVVRHLPGRDLVRASVGAWSSEDELERLAALVP